MSVNSRVWHSTHNWDWGARRGRQRRWEALRCPTVNSSVMWKEHDVPPQGSAEIQKHLNQAGQGVGGWGKGSGSGVDLHSSVLYKELSLFRLAPGPSLGRHCDGLSPPVDYSNLRVIFQVCLWGSPSPIVQGSLVWIDNCLAGTVLAVFPFHAVCKAASIISLLTWKGQFYRYYYFLRAIV